MTFIITPRDKVLAAYELHQEDPGLSLRALGRAIQADPSRIKAWLADRETYDPYLDDIAIERALQGDVPVYDALRHFEREVVLEKLSQRMDRDEDMTHLFGDAAPRIRKAIYNFRDRPAAIAKRKWQLAQPRPSAVTARKRDPQLEASIHRLRADGLSHRAIAKETGTSARTVHRVLNAAA